MVWPRVLTVVTVMLLATLAPLCGGYKEDIRPVVGVGVSPGIMMLQVSSMGAAGRDTRHRPHQAKQAGAELLAELQAQRAAHPAEETADASRIWEEKDSDEQEDVSLVGSNSAQSNEEKTPITIGTCITTQYGYALMFVAVLCLGLAVALYLQTKAKAALITKVRGLRAKLRVDRARILHDEKKLRMDAAILKEDQRILIQAIHDRGNVFFDPELREIVLKREIPFEPVMKGDGSVYVPRANFLDHQAAKLVLSDVAELLRILPSACLLIEGHTIAGSLDTLDEFAHEVADSRAAVVKETLVLFGTPPYRLEALGLPGALGNNKAEVLLKLVN